MSHQLYSFDDTAVAMDQGDYEDDDDIGEMFDTGDEIVETEPVHPATLGASETKYDREEKKSANEPKYSGPLLASNQTVLAQLLDPTVKAVSQQTIVIDNILTKISDMNGGVMELFKQMEVARHDLMRLPAMGDTDITAYLTKFEALVTVGRKSVALMQEAQARNEGLIATIEGDTGIYAGETVPTAPLMRRRDGTSLKQSLYAEIRTNVASNRNQTLDANSDDEEEEASDDDDDDDNEDDVTELKRSGMHCAADKNVISVASQAPSSVIGNNDNDRSIFRCLVTIYASYMEDQDAVKDLVGSLRAMKAELDEVEYNGNDIIIKLINVFTGGTLHAGTGSPGDVAIRDVGITIVRSRNGEFPGSTFDYPAILDRIAQACLSFKDAERFVTIVMKLVIYSLTRR
ncbi:hypothetical protein QBC39DRAFT_375890 [Podospora conica]|nr:hypothetical protein QBC39DRAFT_375890 [Schizothecium conicum]